MIYLLRHGQTRFNVERRLQGAQDSALTPLGEAQARAMGAALRERIDPAQVTLFSSPQGRAVATARIVGEAMGLGTEPVLLGALVEVSLGSWDGRTVTEISATGPENDARLNHEEWFFQSPDGDRFEPFRDRAAMGLAQLLDHPSPIKIAVSHGVASRVLRGLYLNLPREDMLAHHVPHGRIYRLHDDAITEIDCA